MRLRRILVLLSVLLIALQSCNMPLGKQQSGQPDLAATITAQAAALQNAASTATPGSVPVTGATPAGVQVSVTSVTNCRTGPSSIYDLVITVNPGPSYQVIGKNTSTGYWIINNPAGGTCWLWGQYAVVTGDSSGLPEYPAPPPPPQASNPKPTKTPKPAQPTDTPSSGGGTSFPIFPVFPVKPPIIVLIPPSAPTNLAQSRTCDEYIDVFTPKWKEQVSLTWTASSGQSGYHIYKGGAVVSNIPQNSTSYNITLNYDTGTGGALYDTFGVQAYNAAGTSSTASLDVPRCP